MRSLVTSLAGAGPLGTVTTGFLDSGEGGLGVVADVVVEVVLAAVTAAWVAPPWGAGWMPGAFELPQPARARAATASGAMTLVVLRIESTRLASRCKNRVAGLRAEGELSAAPDGGALST